MFWKRLSFVVLTSIFLFSATFPAHAIWIWNPDGKGWFNPKNAVKETPELQLEFVKSFLQQGELPVALKEANKLLKAYPRAREAADAQFLIGEVYERMGKFYEAYKAYQLVLDRYPFSNHGTKIVQRQYVMAEYMLEGKDKQGMLSEIVVGANQRIVEMFKAVIKNDPYGEYAPKAQYKMGLFYKENKMWQDARDAFEKTVNDYPGTEWAKSAVYQIAQVDAVRSTDAQYDQQVTQVAVEGFKDFIQDFPESELSQEAKDKIKDLREKEAENAYVVAEFYEKQKKPKAAKIYYQELVEQYSDTTWAKKALERIRAIN